MSLSRAHFSPPPRLGRPSPGLPGQALTTLSDLRRYRAQIYRWEGKRYQREFTFETARKGDAGVAEVPRRFSSLHPGRELKLD